VKTLKWVGGARKDLTGFPARVRREMGYVLYVAQQGESHESVKPFRGHGSGVYEIVTDYNKNAYRAVYFVNLYDAIYVLHAFQKKSKKGIKTPKEDLNVIRERLKYIKSTLVNR